MGRLYDAFVEVGPRFTGFGDIKRQGDQAGKEYGKALADAAAKAAAANVRKLGEALAKARSSEADAAGKVRIAETKLNEVRADSKAKASQIAAAEEALASAQRKSAAASDTAKSATESLDKARSRVADTAASTGKLSGGKFTKAFRDQVTSAPEKSGKVFATRFGVGLNGAMAGVVSRSAGIFVAGFAALKGLGLFKDFIAEARDSRRVGALTNQVIKSTGGAAKISAQQVGDLATAISNVTGADDEAVQSGENLLLTFTNVRNGVGKGNKVFDQASQAVVDMTAALNDGQVTQEGVKSASIQLGKALNDPIKGVTALSKVGVSFTKQQKDQIKTLVDSGDVMGAQKIILKELGKEFGGAATAATDPLQKLSTITGNLKEKIGTALLPYVDKAATWLGKYLPIAVDTAGRFFNDKLLPALQAVRDFFKDHIIPVAENVVTAFTGLGKKIVNAIGKVDLSGIAAGIFNDTKAWAGSVISGLKSGIDTGDWKPLGKSLGDGVIRAIQTLGDKSAALLDAIGGLIDKVDWGALGTKVSNSFLGLIHSIDWGAVGGAVGDALIVGFQKAKDVTVKLGNGIKAFIDAVDWQKVGKDSTNAIGRFIAGIDWGQLAKALGAALVGSVKVNVEVRDAVIGSATDVIIGVYHALAEWGEKKFYELGPKLWEGLKSGISAGAKGIGSFLKSIIVDPVVNIVKAWFGVRSPSTVFAGIGAQLIAGLKGGIAAAMRGIGGWLSRNVINPVVEAFNRAGSWLVQHGRNLVAGFKDGVSAIARGIGRWMYDHIISPAVAPFMKAGTWLVQAGRNVIDGFGRGMRSIWDSVTKWVGGIATWIKDNKGPVSLDGRLLVPAGRAIMSGFLSGLKSGAGPAWSFVKSVGGKTKEAVATAAGWIKGLGWPSIGSTSLGTVGAGVERWRAVAAEALRLTHSPANWIGSLLRRMMRESGGNPHAINLKDINAQRGDPSRGLMQTIGATFNAYKRAGVSASSIWDPLENIIASINYANARYGAAPRGWDRAGGYKLGTPWVPDDQLAFLHKGEGVIPRKVNEARLAASSGGGAMQLDDATIGKLARALAREIAANPPQVTMDSRRVDQVFSRRALGEGY
jgi:hypothetical protein